jgi:hypothetical protein
MGFPHDGIVAGAPSRRGLYVVFVVVRPALVVVGLIVLVIFGFSFFVKIAFRVIHTVNVIAFRIAAILTIPC